MTGVYVHGPGSEVMVRALMICAGQRHIEAQVCMANITFVFRGPHQPDLMVIGRYSNLRRADATQPHAVEAALARAARGEPIVMSSAAEPGAAIRQQLAPVKIAFAALDGKNWDNVYEYCKRVLDIEEPSAEILLDTKPFIYGLP